MPEPLEAAPRARPARHAAELPRLAAGSRPAHAHEQPRPRGRRARPQELIVYGGAGKAARNWECFDAIVATLRRLEDDETLLVQSGKPVGVFATHEWAPRVLIANANLVARLGELGRVPPPRRPRASRCTAR